jgi:hypothetical protein
VSQPDLAERDTLPPDPGEAEEVTFAEKVLRQLDRIEAALATLTDEVMVLRGNDRKRESDVAFLDRRVSSLTPAAGMPAVHPGNGNGGHE